MRVIVFNLAALTHCLAVVRDWGRMPRNISRREVVQAAGIAVVGVVAATALTGTANAAPPAAPPAEPATGATAQAGDATLFPWIGI